MPKGKRKRLRFVSYFIDYTISNILFLIKDTKDMLGIKDSNANNYRKYSGKNSKIIA